MSFFDELKASLEEAVEIKNGVREPARVTRYELADVKAIRAQLNVSQSEMAKVLGTSLDTIKSWETGRRNPTGLAAKVLATIQANPILPGTGGALSRCDRRIRQERPFACNLTATEKQSPGNHVISWRIA